MAKASINWEGHLAAWLEAKRRNPTLTHDDFFRQRGLKSKTARKKIGRKMTQMWEQVRERARDVITKQLGDQLAHDFQDTFKKGKRVADLGLGMFLPGRLKGKVVPPRVVPADAMEAARAANVGVQAMNAANQAIHGGQPLVSKSVGKPKFTWTEAPDAPPEKAKPSRAKAKKRKPSRGGKRRK